MCKCVYMINSFSTNYNLLLDMMFKKLQSYKYRYTYVPTKKHICFMNKILFDENEMWSLNISLPSV